MNKILNIVIASIAAIITVSCAKVEPFVANHDPAHRTFKVNVAQTKTAIDALNMNWVAGDQIKVFGYTAGEPASIGEAVFTIKSGVGTSTAVFEIKEGETLAEYDNYYAVYPSTRTVDTSKLPGSIQVAVASLEEHSIPAAGQYDPSYAIMAAVGDGDNLTSYHCMAYIKLQIPEDDITNVQLQFANNCTGKTSVSLNTSSKAVTVGSGSKTIKAECAGGETFTKGNWYYLPTPARSNDPGTLTVTFKKSGGESYSVSTSSLSSTRLGVGQIYNIGSPAKVPVISAPDVNIEADETAGSIDFTVSNLVDGGVVTKSVVSSTIANLSLGAVSFNTSTGVGSVSFTSDENDDDENDRTAVVQLTYTYGSPAQTQTKNVTITQNKKGFVSEVYNWDFNSAGFKAAIDALGTDYIDEGAFVNDKTFTIDGLSYTTSSGSGTASSWGTSNSMQHIRAGGKGSDSQRYFSFTVSSAGTVTVRASSTGSSARAIYVNGTKHPTKTSSASSAVVDFDFAVTAGTVKVYPGDGDMRVYSVSFTNL